MFDLTDEESAILDQIPALDAERKQLNMQLRFMPTGTEEQAQMFAKVSNMDSEIAALKASEVFALAELKKTINEVVSTKLPFPPSAVLTLAEQLFPIVTDSPNSLRVQLLMKNMVLRLMQNMYDADIAKARASGFKVRYDAMLATGLPEDFVQKILIAEASKPISVSAPIHK